MDRALGGRPAVVHLSEMQRGTTTSRFPTTTSRSPPSSPAFNQEADDGVVQTYRPGICPPAAVWGAEPRGRTRGAAFVGPASPRIAQTTSARGCGYSQGF